MNKKQLFSIALLFSVATAQVNAALAPAAVGATEFIIEYTIFPEIIAGAAKALATADALIAGGITTGVQIAGAVQNLGNQYRKNMVAKVAQPGYVAQATNFVKSSVPALRTAGVVTAAGLGSYEVAKLVTDRTSLKGTKTGTVVNAAVAAGTVAGLYKYTGLIAKAAAFNPWVIGGAAALSAVPMIYRNGGFGAVKNGAVAAASWMNKNRAATALTALGLAATGGAGWYFAPQIATFASKAATVAAPYIMTKKAAGVAGVAAAVGLGGYVASKLFSQSPELPEFGPENKPKGWRDNNPAPAIRLFQAGVDYQLQGGKFLRPLVSMTDAEVAHYTAKHAAGRAK